MERGNRLGLQTIRVINLMQMRPDQAYRLYLGVHLYA